jgi:hypothetical protein
MTYGEDSKEEESSITFSSSQDPAMTARLELMNPEVVLMNLYVFFKTR